jgi:hypothetical protein
VHAAARRGRGRRTRAQLDGRNALARPQDQLAHAGRQQGSLALSQPLYPGKAIRVGGAVPGTASCQAWLVPQLVEPSQPKLHAIRPLGTGGQVLAPTE